MITIKKPNLNDVSALSVASKKAFFVPHKSVIPKPILDAYLEHNFNEQQLTKEITDVANNYHIIEHNKKLAGFSKIIFNQTNSNINVANICKMERLYLLEDYYGLGLGKALFNFNVELAKKNKQNGFWLYVWIKNYRALEFYKKTGFKQVGTYDFPISDTETRLNYVMFLEF